VREFRIGSDVFGNLRCGEAVIDTPVAGEPTRAAILPVGPPALSPSRIDPAGAMHRCEIAVHPEECLPDFHSEPSDAVPADPASSPPVPAPNDGFKPKGF
jgi:hypothetical protein